MQGENPIVDSLAVVSEWTIVAKCALHGLIYMWDLKWVTKFNLKYEGYIKGHYWQIVFLLLSRSTTKNLTADDSKKEKIIEKEVGVVFGPNIGFPEIKNNRKETNSRQSESQNMFLFCDAIMGLFFV